MTKKNISVPRLIDTFKPEHYDLSLTLNEKNNTFTGTVSIKGVSTSSSISLHAKELAIDSAHIDGSAANWNFHEFDTVTFITDNLTAGHHIIVISFSGTITDSMHGLYPCYFTVDGKREQLLATQFESHHAREVFPCVDEPLAKATFDLTLTTEKDITVLSNMPTDWQRTENGKLVTAFQTTPRMSTYLLAWVAGDLQSKTIETKRGVKVSVYATHAQSSESLNFALHHAAETIDFFEDYFGVNYPLPKSDQVALPDFSSGAMENWGLITYRESALLVDPKDETISTKQRIAEVISHELSHQWFGNLVTMSWWNDLWLNESFATLMAYTAVDAIHPEYNMWLEFASYEGVLSLRRDAIDGVQPVQVDVNHPDEISSLFDPAIVYAKGARLMRMLQQFIKQDAFRKGLTNYFNEFAYHNTEAADLWRHLSETSGNDIAEIMTTWISQGGYPVVHVHEDGLAQERFFIGEHASDPTIWSIPLDAESTEDVPALLTKKELAFPVSNEERFNIHDASHYITHYEPSHLKNLLKKIGYIDAIGRMQLLHEQTLLARGGVISSARLVSTLEYYKNESSAEVWDVIAIAINELKKFVEPDTEEELNLQKRAIELAAAQYERLGWNVKENEHQNDTKLRPTIISLMLYGRHPEALQTAEKIFSHGIDTIPADIRPIIISAVVKQTTNDDLVTSLLEQYRSTPSAHLKEDIAAGLTSVKQPQHVQTILSEFINPNTIRPQDLYSWFAYMIRNRYAHEATWQWMTDNWQWIIDTFSGDKSYDSFPRYAASGIRTHQQADSFRDFFDKKREIPALTRTIDLGYKEIKGLLSLIERDQKAVLDALSRQDY